VLYPGSPQAMDPGESGVHGAWLIEIGLDGSVEQRQIPLSTVRYEAVPVDLSGIDSEDAARQTIIYAVRGALNAGLAERGRLECLCCRLTLTGRTSLHRQLPALIKRAEEDLNLTVGGVTGLIEHVIYATRPEIDLAAFAGRNDPPGEVARVIQAFEREASPPGYRELLNATVGRLREVDQRSYGDIANDAEPSLEQARRYLVDEAWSLLDTLVAQKESV
jgi:hypothetical protein